MQNCKIANNCQPNLSAQRLSDFNSQRLDDTRTITRSRKRKQKDVDDSDYQPNNEWQPKTKKRKLIHSRIDSLVILPFLHHISMMDPLKISMMSSKLCTRLFMKNTTFSIIFSTNSLAKIDSYRHQRIQKAREYGKQSRASKSTRRHRI